MAKIKHNNFLDTVDSVFNDAKRQGVLHLYAEGDRLTVGIYALDKGIFFTSEPPDIWAWNRIKD